MQKKQNQKKHTQSLATTMWHGFRVDFSTTIIKTILRKHCISEWRAKMRPFNIDKVSKSELRYDRDHGCRISTGPRRKDGEGSTGRLTQKKEAFIVGRLTVSYKNGVMSL